jgi:hypothetical protein
MNFRTWPTGSSIAHGPKIILFPQAHDTLSRYAYLLVPDVKRLVIVAVNSNPELIHWEL